MSREPPTALADRGADVHPIRVMRPEWRAAYGGAEQADRRGPCEQGRLMSHVDEEASMPERSEPQRDVLPIPDVTPVGLTTYDAKDPDTKYPPIRELRPPDGAPNVLIVLIDDCGFGATSAFGGPVATPTAERLAASGLKYNRFHTTALCSPT